MPKPRNGFSRRNGFKKKNKPPAWRLRAEFGIRGRENVISEIRFGAYEGRDAKREALIQLRKCVRKINDILGCEGRVEIIDLRLEKLSANDPRCPVYVLKPGSMFCKKIMSGKPSQVFKAVGNGHNGNHK